MRSDWAKLIRKEFMEKTDRYYTEINLENGKDFRRRKAWGIIWVRGSNVSKDVKQECIKFSNG